MAEDTSENSRHLINAVEVAIDEIKQVTHDSTEKVLVVSNGIDGPHIIAVNSDLVISEFRDDSNSSLDVKDNGTDSDWGEPSAKRCRLMKEDMNDSYKTILMNMHKAIILRLDSIEKKMSAITSRCHCLEGKVESVSSHLREIGFGIKPIVPRNKSGAVIVGLPQVESNATNRMEDERLAAIHNNHENYTDWTCLSTGKTGSVTSPLPVPQIGPNVTLITLNSEDDYPNGSWLGDENNPEMRVRCHISPSDLANINRSCHTAEKMALTLLDYLFDRETQACSNISGQGKHGKKQLDPLMIYGIRCHLTHKFSIVDKDWHRIKQNMDSKCRTAFRRKQKGMPLTVKAFRDRWVAQDPCTRVSTAFIQMVGDTTTDDSNGFQHSLDNKDLNESDLDIGASTINIPIAMNSDQSSLSIAMEGITERQIIHMPQGDIQVLHATPEQIAQFQQSGHIQILAGDQIIQGDVIQASDTLSSEQNFHVTAIQEQG